jgi:hypothetical protein
VKIQIENPKVWLIQALKKGHISSTEYKTYLTKTEKMYNKGYKFYVIKKTMKK